MKYRSSFIAVLVVTLFALPSCSGEDHEDILSNWIWDDTDTTETPTTKDDNPDVVAQGWTNVTANFGDLPDYIQVYNRTSTADGDAAVAYIAVADMEKATFQVSNDIHWSDAAQGNGNESVYTLSEFYENYEHPSIAINGGLFFYSALSDGSPFYYSQSSCYSNGTMLSPNQNYWSENWTDFWYPTIGFFYQDKSGVFHATWTYYASDGNDYSYADVKKIDKSTPETSAPNATSPSEGTVLNNGTAVNGIGGVSVLVHEGIVRDTWADELLDVSANSAQPRTAVGYMEKTKRLVFFVCEGREQTAGVQGMTTAQVANLLCAMGCTEALNLDGGGSSCMLINGKETIKPSDGSQRKVIDACFIK
jgi:hypothetical protein